MRIAKGIEIIDSELQFKFVTSSGPGGQNVNKVSTAVHLSFNLNQSMSLPEEIKSRLKLIAAKRLTRDGFIRIKAQRFRSQERNRIDAINRFIRLIELALYPPKVRFATTRSRKSIQKRLNDKRSQSLKKTMRVKLTSDL
ncbi:MAG: aminoacyl-tRNA hydrolase [SAR202 cluster bacterium]|nr:aminoacyl-tRNA hydrolase [SAR202 cluster bacterium]